MKSFIKFFLFLLICVPSYAQNVEITPNVSPDFFTVDDEITIDYDVTGTSLASLDKAYLWCWSPQDVGDAPSNINPASTDAEATAAALFEKITEEGKTIFRLKMVPNEFFGNPSEDIAELGMILKGDDWGDGQTFDFFISVSSGFSLRVTSPSAPFSFYAAGDSIEIIAQTSEPAAITIAIDDEVAETLNDVENLVFQHLAIADGQVHRIDVTAVAGDVSASYTHSYTLAPETPQATIPAGLRDGINYHEDATMATLVLTAPGKSNVFVLGEFNDWSLNQDFLMNQDGDQFWLEINGLTPGQEYLFQYLVDGVLRIADPYSEKISSPFDDPAIISSDRYPGLKTYPTGKTTEAVTYLQTNQSDYPWEVTDFDRPANEDLIIYEMLIRDFTDTRTYAAAMSRFDYLADLGINAIELMPIMEYEGNESWGYNPAFMTAADKYYGTEVDLKKFIDEAHKRGIAIILDIALNHSFGRNPLVRMYNDGLYGPPTEDNPWLNRTAKHDFNVGYDFNHESELTQDYVDRVVTYWIEEYNVDGYRFDLSKGFTQNLTIGNLSAWNKLDQSRVDLLTRMADVIWDIDPSIYVILEHLSDNEEEKVLANAGMMVWGKMTDKYNDLAAGVNTSVGRLYHEWRGFDDPHIVGYMESHDEERNMWSLEQRSSQTQNQRLERMKLNAAFFLTVPGPKMIWQFGELGYDEELNDDRLAIKPTRWEYIADPNRAKLKDVYQALINLRTKTDYIGAENFEWNPDLTIKWINTSHEDVQISIVGNFSNFQQTGDPHFQAAGTWYDYLSGDEITVEDPNAEMTLAGGEFHVYTSEPIENFITGDPSPLVLSAEEDVNVTGMKVYPIPGHDQVWVHSDVNRPKEVRLFDTSGNMLINTTLSNNRTGLDISGITPGVYFLNTIVGGSTHVNKLIIR